MLVKRKQQVYFVIQHGGETFVKSKQQEQLVNLIIHGREMFVESKQQQHSKVSRLGEGGLSSRDLGLITHRLVANRSGLIAFGASCPDTTISSTSLNIFWSAHLTAFPPDLYIFNLLMVALSRMLEPAAGFARSENR